MAATHPRAFGLASTGARIDAAAAIPAIWLFARLILGTEWLRGAQEKLGVAGWTGDPAGTALTAFIKGALGKATGAHPEVQSWFTSFANQVVLPHAVLFTYLVTFGELLVGIALVVGICTRFAALSGAFLNFMFLSAGTTSSNPQMLLLEVAIVLLGTSAGAYGLDRWAMPWLARVRSMRGTRLTSANALLIPAALAVAALGYLSTDQTTWLTCIGVAALIGVAIVATRRTDSSN